MTFHAPKPLTTEADITSPFVDLTQDRLQQLTATLAQLRERVREAVASEMGKAVGDALRELVTAILSRTATAGSCRATSFSPPPWQDPAMWENDPESGEGNDPQYSADPPPPSRLPFPFVTPRVALDTGVRLAHGMMNRRMPFWAALGAGLCAALAAFSQHPIVQTGLTAMAVAAELIAMTDLAPPSR